MKADEIIASDKNPQYFNSEWDEKLFIFSNSCHCWTLDSLKFSKDVKLRGLHVVRRGKCFLNRCSFMDFMQGVFIIVPLCIYACMQSINEHLSTKYLMRPNIYLLSKNGQIWPKTGILGQISAFLAHLI